MSEDFAKMTSVMFLLSDQEWNEFNAVLDREPAELPNMRVLLAKASVVFAPEVE